MSDWKSLFVPRPPAFQTLDRAWANAKAGQPGLVVLLGETGWGKTRAVQEWYAQLVAQEGAVYWPPRMGEEVADRRNAVFPDFQRLPGKSTDPLKFLFLGMRADMTQREGLRYGSREPLLDLQDQLKVHFLALWAAKHRGEMNTELLKELGKELFDETPELLELAGEVASLIPGISLVAPLFKIRKVVELARNLKSFHNERTELAESVRRPAAETHWQALNDVVEETVESIGSVLSGAGGTLQLPVIIFYDDAHAASPTSVVALQKLLVEAKAQNWPLLIVATHWQREWQQDLTAGVGFATLAKLGNCETVDLAEAVDLAPMVLAAIPGCRASDVERIVRHANGHPLFVTHLLRYLLSRSEAAITPEGLTDVGRNIVGQFSSFTELARARFETLPEHARDVLGWGSLASMRFLHRLSRRLAADPGCGPTYDAARHDAGLMEATTEAYIDPLDYPASEFDQVTFYQLAREHISVYGNQEGFRESVRKALRDELAETNWRELAVPEQLDLLDIAVRELGSEGGDVWTRAAVDLGALYLPRGMWRNTTELYLAVAASGNLSDEDAGWCAQTLESLGHPDEAERILTNQIRQSPAAEYRARFETILADIALNSKGDFEAAEAGYVRGLAAFRELAEQKEADPELSRMIAAALNRLGNLELHQKGNPVAARMYFQESLELAESSVEKYGATPASLRAVSVSNNQLGDLGLAMGAPGEEIARNVSYSLAYARGLVNEFGEDAQSLRDLAISLSKMGKFTLEILGDADATKAHYEEALSLLRRVASEYGETPQALTDLSVILERMAKLESDFLADPQGARKKYCESLELGRQIVRDFGETPAALRGIHVTQSALGDLEYRFLQNTAAAHVHYGESLDIARKLLDAHGDTLESMRDVAIYLIKLGDLELNSFNNVASAEPRFVESLAISREILSRFGETPAALRDLAVVLNRLGDLEIYIHNDIATGAAHYQESYEITSRLYEIFGQTPETLTDLALGLARIAAHDDNPGARWLEAYRLIRHRNSAYAPSASSRRYEEVIAQELENRGISTGSD